MRTMTFILAAVLAGACARTVARGNGLRIAAVWVRNPPRTECLPVSFQPEGEGRFGSWA